MGNYETFIALVRARHAKRAFLSTPVPRPLLAEILESAAHAPSSRNTQPWQVAVLTGESKAALSRRLCDEYDRGVPGAADFLNNPARLEGVYAERARSVGAATLAVKGIDRGDAAARHAHIRENFEFFNAPVEMIFHLAGDAVPGSFLALGCFLQNVMLGLTAAGLGELGAETPEQYVTIAAELAGDAARLAKMRCTMRDRLAASELMDHPDFARKLETAYRNVWERWLATTSDN